MATTDDVLMELRALADLLSTQPRPLKLRGATNLADPTRLGEIFSEVVASQAAMYVSSAVTALLSKYLADARDCEGKGDLEGILEVLTEAATKLRSSVMSDAPEIVQRSLNFEGLPGEPGQDYGKTPRPRDKGQH